MYPGPIVNQDVSADSSAAAAASSTLIDDFAKLTCTTICAGCAKRWSGNWMGCPSATSRSRTFQGAKDLPNGDR